MVTKLFVDPKVTSVRKFYFLEYFYILLKSTEQHKNQNEIFNSFKNRKDSLQLGESKYRKLVLPEEEKMSSNRLMRYEYTFNEVIEESEQYNLLEKRNDGYYLTNNGIDLIKKYETNVHDYNLAIFKMIEAKLYGFHYLIEKCYSANRSGLLVFPIYSPLRLDIPKDSVNKTKDVINYINVLSKRLTKDISEHLSLDIDLKSPRDQIIQKLVVANLIEEHPSSLFDLKKYNVIVKRIRDFWLSYFLNEIYHIDMSLSYFDIWCYRGKQLGIVNATEFYYNFDGKVVYPVSVLSKQIRNEDFNEVFEYSIEEKLYVHSPSFDNIQNDFARAIYESYIDIKRRVKTYFISLPDLRDLVCFKMKISYENFSEFLSKLYYLNLKNEVKISISLEADKLPSETKAIYLKREPIIIDNRSINIIAVDIKK